MGKSRNPEPKNYSALFQELKILESKFKALPVSRPRRRDSSDAAATNPLLQKYLLLQTSPRSLMSSLQDKRSSSSSSSSSSSPSPPRPRNTDPAAVQEILRDRRDALSSGKLRGRRIFEEEDISSEELSVLSFSSISSDFDEKSVVVVEEEEESGGDRKRRRGGGYVAWFGLVFILVILGLVSMSCNGDFLKENELFLVPT